MTDTGAMTDTAARPALDPVPGPAPVAVLALPGADILVAALNGRLDPPELLRFLRELPVTHPWVVLDLGGVPELDPAALAALALTARRLRRHGVRLAVCQLRAQPRRLVADRRFHRIVEVIPGPLQAWLSDQAATPQRWTTARGTPAGQPPARSRPAPGGPVEGTRTPCPRT